MLKILFIVLHVLKYCKFLIPFIVVLLRASTILKKITLILHYCRIKLGNRRRAMNDF